MSIQQFFQILWARKGIVWAALFSCLLAAVVTAEVLPERYVGRARVLLDVIKPDPVTGQVIGNQFLRAYTSTQIETIRDFQTAEPAVERLGWLGNPNLVDAYERSGATQTEDLRHWLAREIIRNTDAKLIDNSNILEITYTSSDPTAAQRIAQVLRDVYIDVSVQYKRDAAGKTADWYQQQVDQAATLVRTAEADRSSFAKTNGVVLSPDNTDLESARLAALSSQTAATAGQQNAPVVRATGGISQSQAQLETLNQQIAQAGTTLGPNHPTYQALLRQRTALQAIAGRERTGSTVSGGGGVNPAAVEAAYQRQKAKVLAKTPEIERVQAMTRDIEQKRAQLAKLQDRAAESRLSANVADSGLTVLGNATAPEKPDYPNRPLIWAAAVAFGLILGICVALLVELLGRRVRSAADLETSTGAPVLAEISLSPKVERKWLPALRAPRLALPAPRAA